MDGSFLGPAFAQTEVESRLANAGAIFTVVSDAFTRRWRSGRLDAGRMEFGRRVLGARSLLDDPRSPTMQKTLNLRVKYRESFRLFAPAVLREDVGD
jgi:carbamoyltransferase